MEPAETNAAPGLTDHPSTGAGWRDFVDRGLVAQSTVPDMDAWLSTQRARGGFACYSGFDPTSDSLHIGNLVPAFSLRRFMQLGATPIALVGGATGMIGDPSGKSAERTLLDADRLAHNTQAIGRQLERLMQGTLGVDFHLKNNAEWLRSMTLIEFLRDVGKHFSVNMMMAKESVRARLEDRDHGISYTEFSYMILQAYDYNHLYETMGCRMQIGGNDQWGNITAGIDLIRHRHHGADVAGVTFPLITTASGAKFGKSERGNIWIDPNKTHPYFLYKYFFDSQDADVGRYLRIFTFLPIAEIASLEASLAHAPQDRLAHKALAKEVTALVHGLTIALACEGLEIAMHRDDIELFQRHAETLGLMNPDSAGASAESAAVLPVAHRPLSSLAGEGILAVDLAVEIGLFNSKGEVRREIASGGGFRVAGQVVTLPDFRITSELLGGRKVVQLKRGKKNKRLVCFY